MWTAVQRTARSERKLSAVEDGRGLGSVIHPKAQSIDTASARTPCRFLEGHMMVRRAQNFYRDAPTESSDCTSRASRMDESVHQRAGF
jgi:hypothetical protein